MNTVALMFCVLVYAEVNYTIHAVCLGDALSSALNKTRIENIAFDSNLAVISAGNLQELL